MSKADSPEVAGPTPESVKSHAFRDAQNIEKSGNLGGGPEAYRLAYTSFASELHSLKPQEQAKALSSYHTELGRALGPGQLQKLELTFAGEHIDDFSSANHKISKRVGRGSVSVDTGTLDADKMERFQSARPDSGERAFQNVVVDAVNSAYKKGEFQHSGILGTSYGADNSYISKDDLLAKGADLRNEKRQAARSEAFGLLSPISPQLAKEFGIPGKDGKEPTLYDLLAEKDGSIKKYGYNTQFQNIHGKLRDGDLSSEQRKAVDNLWDKWNDPAQNPLKDARTGAINAEGIKKATGEDLSSLRSVAPDWQKARADMDAAAARKQAGVVVEPLKAPDSMLDPTKKTEADPNKKIESAGPVKTDVDPNKKPDSAGPAKTEVAPIQKPGNDVDPARKSEAGSFVLDGDSILDKARALLQEKMQTSQKKVADAEVRSYVASIAKANHLPGSESQWAAFVRDGKQSHLPKALNQALHRGIVLNLPTDK